MPRFHAMLVFGYLNQKRTNEARATAERALTIHPQDSDCLNALAFTLASGGDAAGAEQLSATHPKACA